MNPLIRGIKTILQVGLLPVLQVGLYRFGLLIGHYRRVSNLQVKITNEEELEWLTSGQAFSQSALAGYFKNHPDLLTGCMTDAEMIRGGKCRIFGHQTVDIFQPGFDSTHHWTEYESGRVKIPVEDIKFIWEPARLGWIFALSRASAAGQMSDVGKRAWGLIDEFLTINPPNFGPNWMNGQEVALRIVALVFFHEVFREETGMPASWEQTLAQAVAAHAGRISPTLVYARSQKNNHLLVEAVGLYTAGIFLPDHPEAGNWRKTGWQVFHQALDDQIQDDGTYGQFSTNYHRLMLQISLWMKAISLRAGDVFPEQSQRKLAAATNWLKALVDPKTGLVPNYGHNDGAYILPLTGSPFQDFRPIVRAASQFFGPGMDIAGQDEMTLWFEWLAGGKIKPYTQQVSPVQSYQKLELGKTSVVMFAPHYTSRPGQADVLHTEIWRDGNPVTLGAGTYLYNGTFPWENTLAQTKFHNTVTVNQDNQMLKAGRFLWLDWPKTKWTSPRGATNLISAEHDGYKKFGVIHHRQIECAQENRILVTDSIHPLENGIHSSLDIWLHWLLPDLDWRITDSGLVSGIGFQKICIDVLPQNDRTSLPAEIQLIKGGILVGGHNNQNTPNDNLVNFGWYSPTYALKIPVYSYRVLFHGNLPITFHTQFQFG